MCIFLVESIIDTARYYSDEATLSLFIGCTPSKVPLLDIVYQVLFHSVTTFSAPARSDQGMFDFRQGEARSVLRADGVDEPSSREENQSDHHFLQTETSFTGRTSLVFWSP